MEDIYGVLTTRPQNIPEELTEDFGRQLSHLIKDRLTEDSSWSLRMSNLGEKCLRKLWYEANTPEKKEPLSGATRLKFLYGDIIEHLLLFLAKISGHTVENEQTTVELGGVKGHTDATIDAVLVDVKSTSSRSFDKFASHLTRETDSFGYLVQLGGYGRATGNDKRAFVAVDKQHGYICVDNHEEEDKTDYFEIIDQAKRAISLPEPPERYYRPEPDGKSGNEKLGTACSYCDFKKTCYPNLRTFKYKDKDKFKERYLTKVARTPDVEEAF